MTRAEPNRLLSRDVFGPVRENHHHHNDKSLPHNLSARRARNRVAPYYNQNLYKNSPSSIKAIGGRYTKRTASAFCLVETYAESFGSQSYC